ncbi:MAG: hypothetical protein ABIR32_00830, partial [Ilumatobacteraceae bacterium]
GRRDPFDSLDAIGGSWLVGGAQAGPDGHGEAVRPAFPAVSAVAELVEFQGDQASLVVVEFDRSLLFELLFEFIWVVLGTIRREPVCGWFLVVEAHSAPRAW